MTPMSNRQSFMCRARLSTFLAVGLLVGGCEFTRTVVGGPDPIPVGPVGPVVQNPNGGPPVECRGMPIQQCQQSAPSDLGRNDVVRAIVTCTKVCTPIEGEYRLDLVTAGGRVEQAGGGGYASAPATAPEEPEPAPTPS
jgi:hypothetical protein